MVLEDEVLWVFLFTKKVVGLVVEFFNRRSSSDIIGVSVKIVLNWFQNVKLELQEADVFILPERGLL